MQLVVFLGILTILNVSTFVMVTNNIPESEVNNDPIPHVITVTPIESN